MRTGGAAAREVGGGGSGGRVYPTFDFSDGSGSNRDDGSDSSDWAPESDSDVQLSDGDEDFESGIKSAGRTPVSKRPKRKREVVRAVWTVPGDNTREFVGRYNPAGGDCGPYSVGQVASSETPSSEELRGYREAGVQYVLDHPTEFSDDFWDGDTREKRERSRDDWARRMLRPREWADYPLMLGMRAVYCTDAIIVEPKFPGDQSNRELRAYGQDVLDASKPLIMIQGGIHFLVLDEVGRGGDGGSGDGDGREPSSSSSSSNSGAALSPAQAAAMESLERNAAWFLRIEDREVTPAEKQEARRLLENPRELHGLRNEALDNPQVYRGTRSAEDLDRHQLRNLVGAALLPENGLSKILGFFHGDLQALESACAEAELQGPVEFSKFLGDQGVDAPVAPNHPAFAGDPATWTRPILLKQGMCLQYQKRAFYSDDPTTTTGKASAAANKVSSFEGGPAGHGNRLGSSCVKVEADRDGSSASAIPHCAALLQLRRELRQVAGVVERSFARSFLHYFTATPGVGVFRGGDIAQAGRGRNTVQELASVEGRKAFVYWGRHQSKAIGDPEALESAARGDLELYKACTNGEAVTDMRVGEMMLDILMEAIEIHAEANGGPTDNDIRRHDELEEARDQGLPQILEVTGRIGKELRGKHVRTREDCRAGGKTDYQEGERRSDGTKSRGTRKRKAEGANTGHVLDGKLVPRGTPGATRITEGAASLKGAASTGVNPEARGPKGPTGGGWDRDLMDDHRFPAGGKVKIKGKEVALPRFTLRYDARHETVLSFLVETSGLVIAEERYCCSCTAEAKLADEDKKTLKAAGIDAFSRATCQRRRRGNKLILRP